MKIFSYFWRKGIWTLSHLLFIAITLGFILYIYLASELPSVSQLNNVKLQVPLRIYTQEGKLIQEFGEKKRIPLPYAAIPKDLIHAVIATEDQRFFEHKGVDFFGLGRAAVKMIQTGSKSQGGSTITMQVARNFFLSRKKTFLRKFNEILLAIKIDQELSKEKILELYLNKIYLGNRAYGVGAAAEVYYGKSLDKLTLPELATLAGLPQAPSTQNPLTNPKAAILRRNHVLNNMYENHYITKIQLEQALKTPLTASYHGTPIEVSAPYVAEMIRDSLYQNYGENAYTNGYKVYTTIKAEYQKAANATVIKHLMAFDHRRGFRGPIAHLKENITPNASNARKLLMPFASLDPLEPVIITSLSPNNIVAIRRHGKTININNQGFAWVKQSYRNQLRINDIVYVKKDNNNWYVDQVPRIEGVLIAMQPNNGAIESLVGGFNFYKSKFNRATQSVRQPGSSFKPFLYGAALDHGYTLATLVNDGPIVVDDPGQPKIWRPHNDNKKFGGMTRLKEALIKSRNMVSIRILDALGFDNTIDFATRFGFNSKTFPRGLSLALGTLSVSPMELTTAYAVFANGGYKINPYLVDHITDNDGNLLSQAEPIQVCESCKNKAPMVLPEDLAFLMYTALQGVVQHGTAHAAMVLNRLDLGGKTGTTNDQVDAWFVGFNKNIVTTTWMGYDQPASLHRYAAELALPMWIDFMHTVLPHLPTVMPIMPKNIIAAAIDPTTGLLARKNQHDAIIEYFREDTLPTEVAPDNSNHNSQKNAATEDLF